MSVGRLIDSGSDGIRCTSGGNSSSLKRNTPASAPFPMTSPAISSVVPAAGERSRLDAMMAMSVFSIAG